MLMGAVGCAAQRGSVGAVLAKSNSDGSLIVRSAPERSLDHDHLEPEDEILTIDGIDVRAMSAPAVHQALEGDTGTIVRLTVLRHGQIVRLSVLRVPLRRVSSAPQTPPNPP